ncbi:MAG: C-GCAxxG-C-C family protein [Firmicutes bacterium]|nr:C-GCAxxG-C-C family protein [Bacillota bacterium]
MSKDVASQDASNKDALSKHTSGKTAPERAAFYFDRAQGFNCAESVLLGVAGKAGNLVPRIATGFGAGFGRRGVVCGAVSGGTMAIGLKFGRDDGQTPDAAAAKERCYQLTLEFCRRFEEEFGSCFCRDLTGCDLTTPEGRQKADELDVHNTSCMGYVKRAAEILEEML